MGGASRVVVVLIVALAIAPVPVVVCGGGGGFGVRGGTSTEDDGFGHNMSQTFFVAA